MKVYFDKDKMTEKTELVDDDYFLVNDSETSNDETKFVYKKNMPVSMATYTLTANATGASYLLENNKLNLINGAKLASGTQEFALPVPKSGITNDCDFIFEIDSTLPTITFAYHGGSYPSSLVGFIPNWKTNKKYHIKIEQYFNYLGNWEARIIDISFIYTDIPVLDGGGA